MNDNRDDAPREDAAPIEQSPYQQQLSEQAHLDLDSPPPASSWDVVRAKWDSLSSVHKLRAKQLGVAAAIGVLGYGLYTASGSDEPVVTAPVASKLDMGAGLRGDSLEEKLRGDLKKVLDGQQLLGDRVSAIEEGKAPLGPRPAPGRS